MILLENVNLNIQSITQQAAGKPPQNLLTRAFEGVNEGVKTVLEARVKDGNVAEIDTILKETLGEGWEKVGRKLGENQVKIIALILADRFTSARRMAEIIGISTTAIEKNISKLKDMGIIKRTGPDRGGHWEIVEAFE